jgi:7-carboxy-7-deazaguanine synthase
VNVERYRINEIFCSLQGEGMRAGTLNHFVRFSGCNLQCAVEPGPLSPGGFDCDTEFISGRRMSGAGILAELKTLNPKCRNIIFTGGEPTLQLDTALVEFFREAGYFTAIETNGTADLEERGLALDWVTCSPKVAEHAVRTRTASEVKYVRGYGQGIPLPHCQAEHKLLSPAFNGIDVDRRTMEWCIGLVHDNPEWRLSVQLHKFVQVR